VVGDHLLGEGAHVLVLGLVERLFARLDVELPGGLGDLGVSGFGGRIRGRVGDAQRCSER